ncbi:hypothetical protein LINPERHAP2_LOCUS30774 [Linum perenne]
MGATREIVPSETGHGVVLLLSEGPEVPERVENEQSDKSWILESNRQRPEDRVQIFRWRDWISEDASFLPGEGPVGRSDGLGYARISPRR